MKAKNIENVPIRSFEGEFDSSLSSRFAIDFLKEDKEGEGITVEAHRHDYYHIMYFENGTGQHVIDFKTFEVKPYSIFFISPGQVHALEVDKDVEGYVISFNSDFFLMNDSVQKLMDYPFFHSLSNDPVIYLSNSNEKIQYLLKDMYGEFFSDERGKDKLLKSLMEILLIRSSRIYEQAEIQGAPMHLTYQLRKLEALVDTHFKEYKMLNDYANLMHISPQHLNSLCKKGINKTVTNLVHERTLTEAKRILLFTDNSITDIADELGFTDKSYFMRFFKKNTGITADSYRKQKHA